MGGIDRKTRLMKPNQNLGIKKIYELKSNSTQILKIKGLKKEIKGKFESIQRKAKRMSTLYGTLRLSEIPRHHSKRPKS